MSQTDSTFDREMKDIEFREQFNKAYQEFLLSELNKNLDKDDKNLD